MTGEGEDRYAWTETITFRENKRIAGLVDQTAAARGTDRSGLYREAMRFWLAKNGLLTVEETRALGVKVQEAV